ncbi:hypothetical protein EAH89_28560 [Roseomonas nepalensis]|uniref:Uncharacterized protein n=1 Tax=Muricoccus nepalensis TaxID=1854500 RepID=A0A502EYW2_9PROT|nr:hypothetical protein [Roseomonas nepalensis]TPG41879.1 hypothetical protein EAH89_28560 [Roseomonas nepalensis]
MTNKADAAPRARLPWDLHPALTEERITACARLLARGRTDALAMADSWAGDDAWSIGCRAYSFSRNRLRRAAEAGRYPWLGVLDETHHFVFLIEGVPVRFFRGDAEEPSKRTLRQQESEAQQLALALGGNDAAEGLMFRLAVETGEEGEVTRVVFLALRGEEGRVVCFWPVPGVADAPAAEPQPRGARGRRNDAPSLQLPLPAASLPPRQHQPSGPRRVAGLAGAEGDLGAARP